MGEPTYFCPNCYSEVGRETATCRHCGYDMAQWTTDTSYVQKLLNALRHPVAMARMGSIITLGNLALPEAAGPLAQCIFDYPEDTWQAMEVFRSLERIPDGPEKTAALQRLASHPSRVVRQEAENLLALQE